MFFKTSFWLVWGFFSLFGFFFCFFVVLCFVLVLLFLFLLNTKGDIAPARKKTGQLYYKIHSLF